MSEAFNSEPLTKWGANNGVHQVDPVLAKGATEDQPSYPEFINARTLLSGDSLEPDVLVEGLVHKGTKVSFAGGSKSYKTWCIMDLAISVASGRKFWERDVTQGKVLYVNLELHPPFIKGRVEAILKARGLVAPRDLEFWNLRGYDCDYESLIPILINKIATGGYALVVLDPIYKMLPGVDDNAAGTLTTVLNQIDRICNESGATVVFAAHFSKGNQAKKEVIDRVSGSGVYARDPDTILTITPHTTKDAFIVEPVLRNLPPVDPFVIGWKFPVMGLLPDLDPTQLKRPGQSRKPTPTLEEFIGIFPAPGEDAPGMSSKDVLQAFEKHRWNKTAIEPLRTEAEKKGLLRVKRGAHNKITMFKMTSSRAAQSPTQVSTSVSPVHETEN